MQLATPPRHSLSDIPVGQLLGEIRRRERLVAELRRKHAAIVAKLERLEGRIANLGEFDPSSRRRGGNRSRMRAAPWRGQRLQRRARNELPLHAAMLAALKGKTMTAGELGDTILRSGYTTTSKNFRQVIALTFLKHKHLFKRVARGKYSAR